MAAPIRLKTKSHIANISNVATYFLIYTNPDQRKDDNRQMAIP